MLRLPSIGTPVPVLVYAGLVGVMCSSMVYCSCTCIANIMVVASVYQKMPEISQGVGYQFVMKLVPKS